MSDSLASNARVYWITWGLLLVLTVAMLAADGAALPKTALVALMLLAMGIKATLIAGNFMHLREEHAGLVLTVVGGLLVMGLVLYVLIAPDAVRIHDMATRGSPTGSHPATVER
jgi:cytochrome c oxidase subunit IV